MIFTYLINNRLVLNITQLKVMYLTNIEVEIIIFQLLNQSDSYTRSYSTCAYNLMIF